MVADVPQALIAQQTLDHEAMWRTMCRLLERVHAVAQSETVIDDCLDIVVEVLGADRGLILVTASDRSTYAVNARGQKKALGTEEREEISKTIVQSAIDSGRCIIWDPLTAAAASSSFSRLGIVAAFAMPLVAGPKRDSVRGVLYLDFRNRRKLVQEHHVQFFTSAAHVIATLLEQHDRWRTTRQQLNEAQRHCVDSRAAPSLEDLLAPNSMAAIRHELESALTGDSPILITGESGTGKTLLAQAIAEASRRRPIVRAVLGSSDDLNTITSELFGHERGSYSGAAHRRIGLVEYANDGTLILDEILNLPRHAQQLLLDFTQFGTYRPLGHTSPEPKRSRVRIIAATNGDLRAAIRERRFREDLYYRLAAVTLEVPPLRTRREDVPVLAERTLRRVDPARPWTLSLPLRRLLVSPAIHWSGNVRQLERAIERARERAVAREPETTVLDVEYVEPRDLGSSTLESVTPRAERDTLAVAWRKLQNQRSQIEESEQDVIREALARSGGVVAHAARELGIARTTLASRLEVLGMRAGKRSPPSAPNA